MEENSASGGSKSLNLNKKLLGPLLLLLLLVLAGVAAYFYSQYQKSQNLLKDPNQAVVAETQTLVNNIGKLIELPANQNPTIATVSDKTKLQDQPFFANAQNGDKVLIYAQAKKAILYRPSINKIIEVAPLAASQPTTERVQVATSSATITPTSKP